MAQAGKERSEKERSEKADILRFAGVLAGVSVLALLVANWQTIAIIIAVLGSEHRPGLLRDARWDAPASAVRFHDRFQAGTPERDLTAWLRKNRFVVDKGGKSAGRQVNGLPCNEAIKVDWSVDAEERLTRADAVVSQIVCL
jgi:hypothetical protein